MSRAVFPGGVLLLASATGTGPLAPPQVRALIPVLRHRDVHVCGPFRLAAVAVTALRGAGIPADRITVTAS